MELYRGDLTALVDKLQREGIKRIWVDGGSTISQFLAAGLVDTMTLCLIPVVLGNGIRLFNVIEKEIPCRLKPELSCECWICGIQKWRCDDRQCRAAAGGGAVSVGSSDVIGCSISRSH